MPSTKTQNKQTKAATLSERATARLAEENSWEQYNSDTKYDGRSMQKSLKALAEKTFPDDAVNCIAYQEAMVRSLTETINPETGIKDFWKAMGKEGCKLLKIENGHLNFYTDKNKKIDITPFTQPIILDVHTDVYNQRKLERERRIKDAQQQLKELLAEIGGQK